MPTTNEQLADAHIRHQIGFTRVSASMAKRIEGMLRDSEPGLRKRILERFKVIRQAAGFDPGSETTKAKVDRLQTDTEKLLDRTHKAVGEEIEAEALAVVKAEPRWLAGAIRDAIVVVLKPKIPPVPTLRQLIKNHPINGRFIKGWIDDWSAGDKRRVRTAINESVLQSETPAQLARRIFGKLSGTRKIAKHEAVTMARTVLLGIGDAARDQFWRSNPGVVTKERWFATLDDNTCPQCGLLDNQLFDIHKGPRPPVHPRCRCVRVPSIDPELIGERPRVSATERDLLAEYAEANGISPAPRTRAGLPRGTKGSYDQFARKRVRELTGLSPASTRYPEFLKRQTKAFQEEHLGKTRAKLFRDGKLPYEKFFDTDGKLMTIDELMRREPEAFKAAA